MGLRRHRQGVIAAPLTKIQDKRALQFYGLDFGEPSLGLSNCAANCVCNCLHVHLLKNSVVQAGSMCGIWWPLAIKIGAQQRVLAQASMPISHGLILVRIAPLSPRVASSFTHLPSSYWVWGTFVAISRPAELAWTIHLSLPANQEIFSPQTE